jgi:hypothetical protein
MKERAGAHNDVANLYAAIEYLRGIPGENAVSFIRRGHHDPRLRALAPLR